MSRGVSHQGPISGVAAHGALIATAGYDGQVILWDQVSGNALAGARHDDLVNQCTFSPDGRLLATASSDASMRLFETARMRLVHAYAGHSDDVMQVRFDPAGQRLATCSYDGTLHVVGLDGRTLAWCEGHRGLIERFAWTPDGRHLRSCGTDGTIRTWDAETGDCIAVLDDLPCDVDDITCVSNNAWIAAMDSGSLLLVDRDRRTVLPAHDAGVKCLVRSGGALLSIGYDQRYKLWTLGGALPEVRTQGTVRSDAWGRSACMLDDGRIVFGSFGSRYIVHDPRSGAWERGDYAPSPSLNAVSAGHGVVYAIGDAGTLYADGRATRAMGSLCNALAVAGDRVLTAGQEGVLFDARSGERLYDHTAPINCIEPFATGTDADLGIEVVLGGYDGSLVRLSIERGRAAAARALRIGSTAVKGVSLRDGLLFCGLADGTLVIVDARSFAVLHTATGAHDSILNGVSFYADGFVTVSRDLTMRRWRRDGGRIDTIATRHPKSIKCVATSPDGRYTASGSYAGTVDVYDHRDACWRGRLRRLTLRGVSSLTWSKERGVFFAAGYDGNVYEVQIDGH